MRTTIKSLWQGLIPIRSTYVEKAFRSKEDLIVESPNQTYMVTYERLNKPLKTLNVRDKFSPAMHKIYYYTVVKEKEKQQKLL